MILRVFSFLILLMFCISCENFPFSKKQQKPVSDTIINFNEVDFSPSFKICDSIIEKEAKSVCFRTAIHQKIGEELQKQVFMIQDSIDEIVNVSLIIDSKGKIQFEKMDASEIIKNQLPKLDILIQESIQKIPAIYPAIKRGIPVTTKYTLPIRIQLKE